MTLTNFFGKYKNKGTKLKNKKTTQFLEWLYDIK